MNFLVIMLVGQVPESEPGLTVRDGATRGGHMPTPNKLPFFARFIERVSRPDQVGSGARVRSGVQAGGFTTLPHATVKYPSDTDEVSTMKYPSDSDEGGIRRL